MKKQETNNKETNKIFKETMSDLSSFRVVYKN